jgi:hypothetical protein
MPQPREAGGGSSRTAGVERGTTATHHEKQPLLDSSAETATSTYDDDSSSSDDGEETIDTMTWEDALRSIRNKRKSYAHRALNVKIAMLSKDYEHEKEEASHKTEDADQGGQTPEDTKDNNKEERREQQRSERIKDLVQSVLDYWTSNAVVSALVLTIAIPAAWTDIDPHESYSSGNGEHANVAVILTKAYQMSMLCSVGASIVSIFLASEYYTGLTMYMCDEEDKLFFLLNVKTSTPEDDEAVDDFFDIWIVQWRGANAWRGSRCVHWCDVVGNGMSSDALVHAVQGAAT